MLQPPHRLTGGGYRQSTGAESLHHVGLVHDEAAADQGDPGGGSQGGDDLWHDPREDLDHVWLSRGGSGPDIGQGQRVKDKEAENGEKAHFLSTADKGGTGTDDAVGPGHGGGVIHRYLLSTQAGNEIGVDDGQLTRLMELLHQARKAAQIAVEEKHHRALRRQHPGQALLVLYGGDDRILLHGVEDIPRHSFPHSLAQSKERFTARSQPRTFSSRWAGEMEGEKVRSTAQLRITSAWLDQ